MKSALILGASITAMLVASPPAHAWDPAATDRSPASEPDTRSAAAADTSDPPPGLYLVTETYVDDVVSRSGPLTVYATETVHEITGSYARVLESVGTGTRSDFDGAAFNGRAAMSDGRPVAGTYYENFVRTADGYIPVSIVFFQDDLEIARAARTALPVAVTSPQPSPALIPPAAPPTGRVTPVIEGPVGRGQPADDRDPVSPVTGPGVPAPAPLPDRVIEVLRARRISVVFSEPILRWRFAGGEGVVLGPVGGDRTQAFVARWDRLPPTGGVWLMRFSVDLADGTTRDLMLRVSVRAPGLVE